MIAEAASQPLRVKIASEEQEFDQIFRLNYETFVEEISQHPPNTDRKLVDRFHAENLYFICLSGAEVVGAVRDDSVFGGQGAVSALTLAVPNEDAMYVVFAVRTGDIDIVRTSAVPVSRTRVDISEVP